MTKNHAMSLGQPVRIDSLTYASRAGRREYRMDVRELLVTKGSLVLSEALRGIARECSAPQRFHSHTPGAFDFRAVTIMQWVGNSIQLELTRPGLLPQMPAQTIVLRRGDYQDRAAALAALLVRAGIPEANVRVAIGKLEIRSAEAQRTKSFDHAWTLYRRDDALWSVMDPLPAPMRKKLRRHHHRDLRGALLEYRPTHVFNSDAIWFFADASQGTKSPDLLERHLWRRINPVLLGTVAGTGDRVVPAQYGGNSIFVSYRHSDTGRAVVRLHSDLSRALICDQLFVDKPVIRNGEFFDDRIVAALAQCDVMLCVIGKKWLEDCDSGTRCKLWRRDDWVRKELTVGLTRARSGSLWLQPILINGAKMPLPRDLPKPLRRFAALKARHFRTQPVAAYEADLRALVNEFVGRGFLGGQVKTGQSGSLQIRPVASRGRRWCSGCR